MINFKPHEYQKYCIDYIKSHKTAALFLDMGLGKTAITLSVLNDLILDELEVSKVLIIAPLRVAHDTWPAELSKWEHLQNLDFSLIIGNEKERISAVNTAKLIYIVKVLRKC